MSALHAIFCRPAWIAAGLAAALFVVAGSAIAQSWPNRPVRLVVPYVPGGATDLVSRIVGEQLTARLGQQLVVDNRPAQPAPSPSPGWPRPAPTDTR